MPKDEEHCPPHDMVWVDTDLDWVDWTTVKVTLYYECADCSATDQYSFTCSGSKKGEGYGFDCSFPI